MKIVKAMKVVARLKGDVKDLKRRMRKCLNAVEGNDFIENYNDIALIADKKVKRMIDLKNKIMKANTEHDKFETIIELGELKANIDFLRELDPKQGIDDDRYRDNNISYKTQLTAKEILNKIEETQKEIEEKTDELDDFNAKMDI